MFDINPKAPQQTLWSMHLGANINGPDVFWDVAVHLSGQLEARLLESGGFSWRQEGNALWLPLLLQSVNAHSDRMTDTLYRMCQS